MRDLVFAMELRGRAAPVEGREGTLKAATSGRGPGGGTVNFESEVVLTGQNLKESGSIEYTGRGRVRFETVGTGHLGPSPLPQTQWGAVIWRITQGEGEFRGATGYITSNFTVDAGGNVVDNHYVRMVLP
jgi:hypothetical protein